MENNDPSDPRSPEDPDETELQITAVHEAAHAVFLVLFGLGNKGVSIEGGESVAGYARGPNVENYEPSQPGEFFRMQKHIIMLLAGAEAVKLYLPQFRDFPQGDESDIEEAETVLELMIAEYHPSFDDSSLDLFREITRSHLGDSRVKKMIIELANVLLDREWMNEDEVTDFVKEKAKEFGYLKIIHRA